MLSFYSNVLWFWLLPHRPCLKTGLDVDRSYRPHCQRKHFPQEFQTCQCCQVGTYLLLFYLYHISYPNVSYFFFISYLIFLRLFNLYLLSYSILSYFSFILFFLLLFYLYHLSYPIFSCFIFITYLILSYLILSLSLILSYLLLFYLNHLFYPIYLILSYAYNQKFRKERKIFRLYTGFSNLTHMKN